MSSLARAWQKSRETVPSKVRKVRLGLIEEALNARVRLLDFILYK